MQEQNSNNSDWIRAYRPFFFENLSGITYIGDNRVLLCDRSRGMLTEVDLVTETETFRKTYNVDDYAGVDSICYFDGYLYSIYQNKVYIADYSSNADRLINERLLSIPDCSALTGIAVTDTKIYLATKNRLIHACDKETEAIEELGRTPGVGIADLCYFNNSLLIVDAKEQTVYVFDINKNKIIYSLLAPFENPTGITMVYNEQVGEDRFYLSYSRPSFEVYDTGDSEFKLKLKAYNNDDPQEEQVTDNFIYPLFFKSNESHNYVLSNGFLVEMYYVEKLHALPEVADEYEVVEDLEWKFSIPVNTDRQELLCLEKMGCFDMKIEEVEEARKVAVFSIPKIDLTTERRIFGWKALVKIFGIRYCLEGDKIGEISEEDLEKFSEYLQDEEGLDMDSWYVKKAAEEAIAHLSERDRHKVIKKVEAIRNYIYERLTYVMDRYHQGTEDVLRSGEGSCGEYLNTFLSLLRLNNIPARVCGDYKVPAYKMQAGAKSVFLSPDFNHVWLQFYVPSGGWMPLESSADDQSACFREWPKSHFMALSWYHMECRAGDYFEEVFEKGSNRRFFLGPGELAKNDIKFKVIRELSV